jgi:hypothetical protein
LEYLQSVHRIILGVNYDGHRLITQQFDGKIDISPKIDLSTINPASGMIIREDKAPASGNIKACLEVPKPSGGSFGTYCVKIFGQYIQLKARGNNDVGVVYTVVQEGEAAPAVPEGYVD